MASSAPANAVAGEPAPAAAQQEKEGRAAAPSPPLVPVPDPDDSALQWDCGVIMHGLDLGINGKLERRHSGVSNIPPYLAFRGRRCLLSRRRDARHGSTPPPGALIRDLSGNKGSPLMFSVCSGRQWSRNGLSAVGNRLMRDKFRRHRPSNGRGTKNPVGKRAKRNERALNTTQYSTQHSTAQEENRGL